MDFRIFTEPQEGATYSQLRDFAREVERLGFDAFFRSDHYLGIGHPGREPGPTDAWVTLAGLAVDTERIRLGTLVTSATFRLPGSLAIQVAQVDEMSGGRVELGLGAGWYEAEHAQYGISFPPLKDRFDRLEEQLAIITGLFETPRGATFKFDGTHYQLAEGPALPKPHQTPRPPVIIGGGGATRTPALAARFANEFNTPFMQPDAARSAFARVDAACRTIGREPSHVLHSSAITVVVASRASDLDRRVGATGWKPENLRLAGACGSPEEVAERLSQWREAGATRLYLQILDITDLAHLEDVMTACDLLNSH